MDVSLKCCACWCIGRFVVIIGHAQPLLGRQLTYQPASHTTQYSTHCSPPCLVLLSPLLHSHAFWHIQHQDQASYGLLQEYCDEWRWFVSGTNVYHDTSKQVSLKCLRSRNSRAETQHSLLLIDCPEELGSHAAISGVEQRVDSWCLTNGDGKPDYA